ncbi:hypothetical protein BgiMline_023139 [Biomphalaria glabrata]|nr:hypothetical protein BgiMline_010936 [Biomphalaria glabrata]
MVIGLPRSPLSSFQKCRVRRFGHPVAPNHRTIVLSRFPLDHLSCLECPTHRLMTVAGQRPTTAAICMSEPPPEGTYRAVDMSRRGQQRLFVSSVFVRLFISLRHFPCRQVARGLRSSVLFAAP